MFGELAAVASVGGGARIPIVTTTLSEHFRVPVITNGQPELTAAIGGGLTAVRGTVEDGQTAMAAAASSAAAATAMAPELAAPDDEMAPSGEFGALAWSDADDVPDVAPTDPYDYDSPADSGAADDVRPQIEFQRDPHDDERAARSLPWYRRPEVAMGAGVLVVLVCAGGGRPVRHAHRRHASEPGVDHRTHRAADHERRATSAVGDASAGTGDGHTGGAAATGDRDGHGATARAAGQSAAVRAAADESTPADHRAAADDHCAATEHSAAATDHPDAALRNHSRSAVRPEPDPTATTGALGSAAVLG